MKRTFAMLAFVFALTVSGFAASGSQADTHLSKKQLDTMIASARTPADHLKIAAYYRAESEKYFAESRAHADMAAAFAANPATNNAKRFNGTVSHCVSVEQSLKAKSIRAAALAEEHEKMAQTGEGQ